MRPDVPPDFLAIIDAARLDQQVDEGFVVGPVGEGVWNAGAREALEDFAAIGFEARPHAHPEGRIGRQRQDVRQEVPHGIHDVDGGVAVFDADMHMQPEDQVGARDHLHVFRSELADSARMCGRKYRMEFMMWMAALRSSMPICTCSPKTRLARAIICMSSDLNWPTAPGCAAGSTAWNS